MGNSTSQRVNSPTSPGLGFSFSNSVTKYLAHFSKQKSNFIQKQPTPVGLTTIFHETIPLNSNSDYIVFPPPLIAIHLLYSAPGELWNWNHPKPRDFRANHTITAHDVILIPTCNLDDIIHSEEYTCVVSTKDGYPIMTHLYKDIVIDCHPIPESMVVAALGRGNHRGETYNDHIFVELLKKCYICRANNMLMCDVDMHKDDAICDKECGEEENDEGNMVKENKS